MYSLDVNFLNDRPEYRPETARPKARAAISPDDRRPLILGGIAAVVLPALALGALLFLQNRNAELEQESGRLDSQLGALKAKQAEIGKVRAETEQTRSEAQALASVFNQIKPWSAMMQDIRDRVPPGVQITSVKQLPATAAAQPQPAASPQPGQAPPPVPAPVSKIEIGGLANSFNDVSDFVIALQKSSFLKADKTEVTDSQLQDNATQLSSIRFKNEAQGQTSNAQDLPKLPQQVKFQIQTTLSEVSASELLRELDRKGATGLVTRIEELQRKGVIQK